MQKWWENTWQQKGSENHSITKIKYKTLSENTTRRLRMETHQE